MKKEKIKTKEEKISIKDATITAWRAFSLVWSKNKVLFSIYLFTEVTPSFIQAISLFITSYSIDFAVKTITTHRIDWHIVFIILGLRYLFPLINTFLFGLSDYCIQLVWIKTNDLLQQMYSEHTSSLDQETLEDSDFQNSMQKANQAISGRMQNLLDRLVNAIVAAVTVFIYLGVLSRINILLVAIVLLIAIPEFIRQTRFASSMYNIWSSKTPERKKINYFGSLLTRYQDIKEIRLYNLRNKMLDEINSLRAIFYIQNKTVAQKNLIILSVTRFFTRTILWGVDAYVFLQVLYGRITIGNFNLYASSVSNFQMSLNQMFSNLSGVYEHSQYVKQVFNVLDTKQLITDSKDAIEIKRDGQAPVINFNHVNFNYPKSKKSILKDFSLQINPGQKIALVGENGAGKSTIIKLLAHLYEPTKGEILINGTPLQNIKIDSWRNKLGILFQDYGTYHITLKENIHYGDSSQEFSDSSIINAAKESGADNVAQELENGYDQMLGKTFEGGVELSGGQWQKVALAKAFYRNADVLILDEPTAAIDAKAEAEIFNKVQKLSKNKTVIIISHRFSTVRHADVIYVLDKGKIIESGSHEELMKENGKYAKLFKLQAKGYQ